MIADDDVRLTSHALGQLTEEETAALERELEADPRARASAQDLREAASALSAGLQNEAALGLAPEHRAQVERAAVTSARARRLRLLPRIAVGVGCAATVLLAVGLMPGLRSRGAGARIRDAAIVDHLETDSDIPFSEPAENSLLGIGGGARQGGRAPQGPPIAPDSNTYGDNGSVQFGSPDPAGVVGPGGDPVPVGSHAERGAAWHGGDAHDAIVESAFVDAKREPLSTFSIDVDTASYAIVRRHLLGGRMPPPGAVRIEEMVNYFSYDYAAPVDDAPFAVHLEAAECPWNLKHRLVRIALKGKVIPERARPSTNLVFLVDVSGSMQPEDRLPLVQKSLRLLVDALRPDDRVAIVVYAGASGLVLPSTSGGEKGAILGAIDRLRAGGSTNGGAGIELAYAEAQEAFLRGGVNRVVLATDGDWNVGVTDRSSLVRLIEEKAKSGVHLTVLGYGMGNLKDATLEQLADKGNGNYGYVDSLAEAKRLLVEQAMGTLVTIAKDVKIQVEWNPAKVAGYRLVGYENRRLAARDFNDDEKDAGEIGAGHAVTAFYEVVPAGVPLEGASIDPLKYGPDRSPAGSASAEMLTVKVRSKRPDADTSTLVEAPFVDEGRSYAAASGELKFAASVATFAMLLRGSEHRGTATYDAVLELAGEGLGRDEGGFRREFLRLVETAKSLAPLPR